MQPNELVLTEPDLLLLRALSEHRLAVVAQAAYWLGVTEKTAARRVRRLADAGLVHHERVFSRGSPMIRSTAAGLKRIDSPLGAPGQKLDEYGHDVGVVWVWTAARAGAFGELSKITSERHLRSHDARLERMSPGERALADDGRFHGVGVAQFNAAGRALRHYPDLVLETKAGKRIAVELELSRKGGPRLDRVMHAYAGDSRIDAVLYLVPDAAMARRIKGAAQRAGIQDQVYVRQLAPGGIAGVEAPEAGRAAPERSRGAEPARSTEGNRSAEPARSAEAARGTEANRSTEAARGGAANRGAEPARGAEAATTAEAAPATPAGSPARSKGQASVVNQAPMERTPFAARTPAEAGTPSATWALAEHSTSQKHKNHKFVGTLANDRRDRSLGIIRSEPGPELSR